MERMGAGLILSLEGKRYVGRDQRSCCVEWNRVGRLCGLAMRYLVLLRVRIGG
jgi:hypothetical protein